MRVHVRVIDICILIEKTKLSNRVFNIWAKIRIPVDVDVYHTHYSPNSDKY